MTIPIAARINAIYVFHPKRDKLLNSKVVLRNTVFVTRLNLSYFCLALCLGPVVGTAGPYDGVYKQTANAECALIGADGGALKIESNIFYGVEVECRMTNPVDLVDMNATLYEMQCSGEGETWTERAMLMPDAEATGIYMIWDGYAFRYDRCEAGEF